MGEARETLGRLISTLQEVNKILTGVEGHADTLQTLQQDLAADCQALQQIGFTGLPATFDAGLQEQVDFLVLAAESMAAALNVSYCPKLEAKAAEAAANRVTETPRKAPNKRTIERALAVGVDLDAWVELTTSEKTKVMNRRARGLDGEALIAGIPLPITALRDPVEIDPVPLHVVEEEIEDGALAA